MASQPALLWTAEGVVKSNRTMHTSVKPSLYSTYADGKWIQFCSVAAYGAAVQSLNPRYATSPVQTVP